jgi:hypothetical protein
MNKFAEDMCQRYYNLASRYKEAQQAPGEKIRFLRSRLRDDALDIRKFNEAGKPFWTIIRWVHPATVLGKLVEGPNIYGLDKIPVVVQRVMRDDGEPRELTERDLMNLALAFDRKDFEKDLDTEGKKYESKVRNGQNLCDSLTSEMDYVSRPRNTMLQRQ